MEKLCREKSDVIEQVFSVGARNFVPLRFKRTLHTYEKFNVREIVRSGYFLSVICYSGYCYCIQFEKIRTIFRISTFIFANQINCRYRKKYTQYLAVGKLQRLSWEHQEEWLYKLGYIEPTSCALLNMPKSTQKYIFAFHYNWMLHWFTSTWVHRHRVLDKKRRVEICVLFVPAERHVMDNNSKGTNSPKESL